MRTGESNDHDSYVSTTQRDGMYTYTIKKTWKRHEKDMGKRGRAREKGRKGGGGREKGWRREAERGGERRRREPETDILGPRLKRGHMGMWGHGTTLAYADSGLDFTALIGRHLSLA